MALRGSPTKPAIKSFESKFIPEPMSGCWLWDAGVNDDGYGCFWTGKTTIGAHRAAWSIYIEQIAPGICVLHRCDTPSCVNPDHLFLGTRRDNNADKVNKGRDRRAFGIKHHKAKLSEADVLAIRADTRIPRDIAKSYGMAHSTIESIVRRKTWKHI
jgi:hypothetical protein